MALRTEAWLGTILIIAGFIIFFSSKTTRGFGCGVVAGGVAVFVIVLIHGYRQVLAMRKRTEEKLEQIAREIENRKKGS